MDLTENVYSNMPWLADYLQLATAWLNPVRQIGWWILCGLGWLVDNMYDAYMALVQFDIYGMITQSMSSVTGGVAKLWPAVLTLSITLMGVIIMVTAKKRKEFGNGIAVAILLLITGPMLFSTCNNFLQAAVPWVEAAYSEEGDYNTKVSTNVINSSSYDLLRSVKFEELKNMKEDPNIVRINEKVGGYFGNAEYFPYWVEKVDPDGTMWGRPLADDAWFMKDDINEGIYRYSFSFFGPFITLLIMLIGIGLGAFKTAKLMFELVFSQTLAPLVFASDLTNSGRSKEIIKKILSTYILIAIVFYGLMLFMTLSLWALDESNVPNIIVRIFLLAGFAWGMIDGPDIVVRLLGIDAGVRSGFGALVGAGMAVGSASRIVRGGAGLVKGVASGAINAGRTGTQWAGKKMDIAKTKKHAPAEVNDSLQGATRKSRNEFHSKNNPAYHNVNSLDHTDQYKGGNLPQRATQMDREQQGTPGSDAYNGEAGREHQGQRMARTPQERSARERGTKEGRSQGQQRPSRSAFPPNPPASQSGSTGYMEPPDLNRIDELINRARDTAQQGYEPPSPRHSSRKPATPTTRPANPAKSPNNSHLPQPGIRPKPPQGKPPERRNKP